MTYLDDALRMAEQGVAVFPTLITWEAPTTAHPTGKWTKVPLTEHGFRDATTDPVTIRWWASILEAQQQGRPLVDPRAVPGTISRFAFGVVAEKFVLLDMDGEKAQAEAKARGLPEGARAVPTMRPGGAHRHFRPYDGAVSVAGGTLGRPKHIDTRGGGTGFAMLYEAWDLSAMPEAPQWVQDSYRAVPIGAHEAPKTPRSFAPGSLHDDLRALSVAMHIAGKSREEYEAEAKKRVRLEDRDSRFDVSLRELWRTAPIGAEKISSAKASETETPKKVSRPDALKKKADGEPSRSQATLLVEIGKADAHLFHDEAGELYGTVAVGGHEETHRLRSTGFRRWLTGRFYRDHATAPANEAVTQARTVLEYEAQFNGPCEAVFLRVAEHEGDLWIDMGDTEWQAIHVTRSGWSVEAKSPVRFVRGRTCVPFPIPQKGGSLTALLPFLRAALVTDPHYVLAVAWVIGAFHPKGPYTILCVNGEQGTGKSSGSRFARALTDPSALPLRSAPKEERDLCVAGNGNRVVAFDNLSSLPGWLSDALCRLSTGGGFGTRQLYTDDDEAIFSGTRPVLLNGIPVLTDAGDLRDRALLAAWPLLPKGSKRREKALAKEFREAHPRIFGAILDALVAALAHGEESDEEGEFRMADFAAWVIAAEKGRALPWPVGTFAAVYAENIRGAEEDSVTEDPLATLVRKVAEAGAWQGTATELMDRLAALHAPPFEGERRPAWWPKSPHALSNTLRRLAPSLRSVGASVEFRREPGGERKRVVAVAAISAQRTLDHPTPEHQREVPSLSSPPSPSDGVARDDRGGRWESEVRPSPPLTGRDGRDGRDGEFPVSSGVPPAYPPARDPEDLLGPGPTLADRALANAEATTQDRALDAAREVVAQCSKIAEPWGELPFLAGMETRGFSPERGRATLADLVLTGAVRQDGPGQYRMKEGP